MTNAIMLYLVISTFLTIREVCTAAYLNKCGDAHTDQRRE